MLKIICFSLIFETCRNLDSSKDIYCQINNLPANDTINKNIRDPKTEFNIDNILIENNRLPKEYWMSTMHKNPINVRFIIAFPIFLG